MGLKLNIWFMLAVYSTLASLKLFPHAQQQVPCYFIFGDSIVDNGNNNVLFTTAKANYPPYGIDFPTGPTGRFSNGRNIADFIAKYLGFENSIQPYVYATGKAILNGVNYGSGAAGIREETGKRLGERFTMDEQLQNHNCTVRRIVNFLGTNATNYLKKCIYTVTIGSNDYINNYLMPKYYNTSSRYNPFEYAAVLLQQYSHQLTTLYNLGARKIAIFGIGLIGCTPFEIDESGSNSTCSATANFDAQLFDLGLPHLINSLNFNLTGAKITYVNVAYISSTPIPNSGFTVTKRACCVVTKEKTIVAPGLCVPFGFPCVNRTTHLFFDAFHPSEHAAELEAKRAYNALTLFDVYPYDISTLVKL